jgi:L-fucono-1,5-lactonase
MIGPTVDGHLHVWDLSRGGYDWLGPHHGVLYRSFPPEEAAAELAAVGVGAAVLVQADNSTSDTDYLLAVADRFPFVAGVVGWLALDDTATAAKQLDRYAEHPRFRGVRHLVHIDPRDDFLALAEVRDSLRLLVDMNLPFDVPDAWPRHLAAVADLADAMPELTVVVDHLAKPPRGTDQFAAWSRAIRAVAARPNTIGKVSGLQMPGLPFTVEALRPVLDLALDAFTPHRLMYGGDWPMTVPAGGYQAHWRVVAALLDELSATERDDVRHGTATRVYGLGRDTP